MDVSRDLGLRQFDRLGTAYYGVHFLAHVTAAISFMGSDIATTTVNQT